MIQAFLIFGALTAMNIGFGYMVSDSSAPKDGTVEIEMVNEE